MKILRVLSLLFFFSFGMTVFVLQLGSHASERGFLNIQIASGESVHDVAMVLKEYGIIRSTTALKLYLQLKGVDTDVRAGRFVIPKDATFAEIADILVSLESNQTAVTIPEGYTVLQIDELLAGAGLMQKGALEVCASSDCDFSTFSFLPEFGEGTAFLEKSQSRLEGYLFPETYFVNPADFVPKFFIERLLGTFRERVVEPFAKDIASSGRSLHEIITMASLIERETSTQIERPIVAGILWKRFDAGHGLDVDATIRYVLGKPSDSLTKVDLDVDSPYNTRKYRGLPPGPIASPGIASIEAAFHPEESPYWYYLHGNDGKIHYSETNEEHNALKEQYL